MHLKMNSPNQTFIEAAKAGIPRDVAAASRIRYLQEFIDHYSTYSDDMAAFLSKECEEEINFLKEHVDQDTRSPINDEMIEAAKQYPVNQLIEFNNGKATAWCHDDSTPSMTYWKEKNLARCWPCNKAYNPIDICMNRDNMSFIEAVRYLNEN